MGDEGHSLQVERQECGRELGPAWMLMWEPLFPHWDTQKVHRTSQSLLQEAPPPDSAKPQVWNSAVVIGPELGDPPTVPAPHTGKEAGLRISKVGGIAPRLRCGCKSGTQRSLQDFLRPLPLAHDTQAATPSLPPAAPTFCKEANEIGWFLSLVLTGHALKTTILYTSENLGPSHPSRH